MAVCITRARCHFIVSSNCRLTVSFSAIHIGSTSMTTVNLLLFDVLQTNSSWHALLDRDSIVFLILCNGNVCLFTNTARSHSRPLDVWLSGISYYVTISNASATCDEIAKYYERDFQNWLPINSRVGNLARKRNKCNWNIYIIQSFICFCNISLNCMIQGYIAH